MEMQKAFKKHRFSGINCSAVPTIWLSDKTLSVSVDTSDDNMVPFQTIKQIDNTQHYRHTALQTLQRRFRFF